MNNNKNTLGGRTYFDPEDNSEETSREARQERDLERADYERDARKDREMEEREPNNSEIPNSSKPSDTPETDRAAIDLHGTRLAPGCIYVKSSFARNLERTRNHAIDALQALDVADITRNADGTLEINRAPEVFACHQDALTHLIAEHNKAILENAKLHEMVKSYLKETE
jgi:hypothetical protein